MTYKLSIHASIDRYDRFMKIIDSGISIGEEFCRCVHSEYPNRDEILTTSGILLVVERKSNILITGYMCNIEKASILYRKAKGYDKAMLPKSMCDRIKANNKILKGNKY